MFFGSILTDCCMLKAPVLIKAPHTFGFSFPVLAMRTTRASPLLTFLVLSCLSVSFVLPRLPPRLILSKSSDLRNLSRRARGGEESGKLAVGDAVSALCPDDDQWYPGAIDKINEDGTYSVKWEDPDGGPESHDVTLDGIKKIVIFKDYKVGERVEAVFPDDGYWYPGEVTKVGDGTFTVKWEDPDGGPEESEVDAKDMKYPPIPFAKLEVGQKYQGSDQGMKGIRHVNVLRLL